MAEGQTRDQEVGVTYVFLARDLTENPGLFIDLKLNSPRLKTSELVLTSIPRVDI